MMRRRILVVDDNSAMAAGLARMLQRDYEVLVCTDGLQALERVFTDGPFDALVVDIRMPAIDGVHLRAALLETSPEQARRMIFVTGGDLGVDEADALRDRIVLRKPFSPTELRLALERVIGATCITPPAMAAVRAVAVSAERDSDALTLPAPPTSGQHRAVAIEEVVSPARRDARRE